MSESDGGGESASGMAAVLAKFRYGAADSTPEAGSSSALKGKHGAQPLSGHGHGDGDGDGPSAAAVVASARTRCPQTLKRVRGKANDNGEASGPDDNSADLDRNERGTGAGRASGTAAGDGGAPAHSDDPVGDSGSDSEGVVLLRKRRRRAIDDSSGDDEAKPQDSRSPPGRASSKPVRLPGANFFLLLCTSLAWRMARCACRFIVGGGQPRLSIF